EAFEGMISYKTSLFSESTIEKLIKHYCFIIDQILKNPCQSISELTLLSPDEYQQVVYKWNQTANEAALTKSINQRFLEQVEKNPDSIALVCNESFLSYQELNHKANQLAAHLQRTL
ncbi:TPA: condensation domain-containing protein, partial [Salmonella enterica]